MNHEPRYMLMVANPVAGRGRSLALVRQIQASLAADGMRVDLQHTTLERGADRIVLDASARNGSALSCVVACGGDGTIQQVASAVAALQSSHPDSAPTLGIVPAGRCNDFARAMSLSGDAARMVALLRAGHCTPVDLGSVNGRLFCTVATVGIDAQVSEFVDGMRLPLKGTPAYLYGLLRVLMRYAPPRLRLSGDFGEMEGPMFLASTANTSSYGGAIQIAPHAHPADGLLDLCVIREVSRFRALTLLRAVMKNRHEAEPEVQMLRTRSLTIESDRPLRLWADGEPIGETPAQITIQPSAVKIVVPRGLAFASKLDTRIAANP